MRELPCTRCGSSVDPDWVAAKTYCGDLLEERQMLNGLLGSEAWDLSREVRMG